MKILVSGVVVADFDIVVRTLDPQASLKTMTNITEVTFEGELSNDQKTVAALTVIPTYKEIHVKTPKL